MSISGFADYHYKAAPYLQENLQVGVRSYNTLCSCNIKGKVCEIVFSGKPTDAGWLCEEAKISLSVPGVPKTPQTYKHFMVAINPEDDVATAARRVSEAILKVTGVQKITVYRQGQGDWHAVLEGNHAIYGIGKTHLEAIGELVMNHVEQFDVEVNIK